MYRSEKLLSANKHRVSSTSRSSLAEQAYSEAAVPLLEGVVRRDHSLPGSRETIGFCRKHQAQGENQGIVKYQLFNEWMASNWLPLLFKKKENLENYSKHNTGTAELVFSSTDKTG